LPFPSYRKHKHNCYCAQEILSGLRQPVGVVHCGDGSQRLFILEKEGFVRILTHNMQLLKEPFLDIHKLVQSGMKVSCTWLLFFGIVLSVGWIDKKYRFFSSLKCVIHKEIKMRCIFTVMVTYVRLRFQFRQWPEKLISELLIRKKLEIIQLQC